MDKYSHRELNTGLPVDIYLQGKEIYSLFTQLTDTYAVYGVVTDQPFDETMFGFRIIANRKSVISIQDGKSCKEGMAVNFIGILGNTHEKNNVEVQGDCGNTGW